MSGTILTFYSYKGGVGRTFVLANVATLLARWGRRVLCVDWDLEAPGLHLYFKRWINPSENPGLVEVVNAWSEDADVDWITHVTSVPIPDLTGTLDVMTAGRFDEGYVGKMQRIDWGSLYEKHGLADRIEAMRDAWRERYDVVLIDSRTGVTDVGGICTIQLPDILVLLYTANDQSVDGVRDVAERVTRARQKLPYDRANVPCVPVATRFDGRVEADLARTWLAQFAERLGHLYRGWCHRDVEPRVLLDFVRIPYVAYWSFGEKLPVLDEGTRAPESVGFAIETLAALLGQGLADTDVLVKRRDTFVALARRGTKWEHSQSVSNDLAAEVALVDTISIPARTRRDIKAVCDLQFDLKGKDLDMLRVELADVRGGHVLDQIESDIRDTRRNSYCTVLFSGHVGSGKTTELRWLARQLQETKEGQLFHVLWSDTLEYLDINSVQLPEFLIALFISILDDDVLRPILGASVIAKRFWRNLKESLKGIGVELEAEIPIKAVKLKAKLKTEFGFQKLMRQALRERIAELLSDMTQLFADLRTGLAKQGVDDLVIIADNLEKIVLTELGHESAKNTHDLFFVEQLPIVQQLHVHLVLTVPVSLHFAHARLRQVFLNPTVKVLPMVPVHLPQMPEALHHAGVAVLKELLRARVDTTELFADDAAFTHAVKLSGGMIRDIFRIVVGSLSRKPAMKLTVADIDDGVKDIVSSYERMLQGKSYLPLLHAIARHASFPVDCPEELQGTLLYSMVVLEYNGTTWYDVHPLARRTRAYQQMTPQQ